MLDLDELERLAKAATPGPWIAGRHDMKSIVEGCPAKYIYSPLHAVAIACGEDVAWNQVICNAEYIAAACNAALEVVARVRELEEEGRTLGERLCETEHDLTEALDKKEELEGRIAELTQENSNQKRVIQMLEYRVLALKGKPIPMEPRQFIPSSNRSNAKEAGE